MNATHTTFAQDNGLRNIPASGAVGDLSGMINHPNPLIRESSPLLGLLFGLNHYLNP
jgi:type VI secretion system protein ImpK